MSDPFATKVPFDASTEKMMNDFPPPPDEPDPVVPKEFRAKRVVPSPRKAPTVRSGKGSIFGKASIPSVYWAGDDPTPMNNDEFTFYREGTPPPESEKGSMSRAWAYRQSVFDHEDSERGRRRRCCGMKRWLFWLLVGLVFLIAMGVGIGVGVGVGADAGKHASQSDQSAETGDPSSTPTETTVPSPTKPLIVPTVTLSSSMTRISTTSETASPTISTTLVESTTSSTKTAASPTATSGPNSICPEADNTIYHVIGSDKTFLRLCGVDYSGDDGAIDMFSVEAPSMGACMEACAKAAQCTGVSWGNVMINGEAQLECWLKRGLKQPHEAVANWNFAILQ